MAVCGVDASKHKPLPSNQQVRSVSPFCMGTLGWRCTSGEGSTATDRRSGVDGAMIGVRRGREAWKRVAPGARHLYDIVRSFPNKLAKPT